MQVTFGKGGTGCWLDGGTDKPKVLENISISA